MHGTPLGEYPDPVPGLPLVWVDLDGVLARPVWPAPHVGPLIPEGRDLLLHYHELGNQVGIWTARPASHHARIWEWLRQHGLTGLVYDVRRKPEGGLYVDDRAWRPPWA